MLSLQNRTKHHAHAVTSCYGILLQASVTVRTSEFQTELCIASSLIKLDIASTEEDMTLLVSVLVTCQAVLPNTRPRLIQCFVQQGYIVAM